MKSFLFKVLIVTLLSWQGQLSATEIIYVTPTGAGSNDGSSWSSAMSSVQFRTALPAATTGTDFYLAGGTYYPGESGENGSSFIIPTGVGVYGGFIGTEAQPFDRNYITHKTTLSGDLDQSGNFSVNDAASVVRFINSSANWIDGVTITGGCMSQFGGGIFVDGASPNITNCVFEGNFAEYYGGAIHADNSSNLTIERCFFKNNSASFVGGAIRLTGFSSSNVVNCIITENTSCYGSALELQGASTMQLKNSTVVNNINSCNFNGKLHRSNGSSFFITNSILWEDGLIFDETDGINVQYSNVKGGWAGTGNVDINPRFENSTDFRLSSCSPMIDAGTIVGAPLWDYAMNLRTDGDSIDIGAWEFKGVPTGLLEPVVTITTENVSICIGILASFTATAFNGGDNPVFDWKVNGISQGANNAIFTTSSLEDGDQVSCLMTSNSVCADPDTASSNTITMTILPQPAISLLVDGLVPVCPGTTITLTASGADEFSLWTSPNRVANNGEPFYPFETETYAITGTGTNGCQSILNYDVVVKPNIDPVITPSGNITITCDAPLGSAVLSTTGEPRGNALVFNGAGSYVQTGGFNFANMDFTIEAWMNPNAWGGYIINNRTNEGNASGSWFNIRLEAPGKVNMELGSSNLDYQNYIGNTTVSLNTWTHIAVVRQGATIQFYINGELDATFNESGVRYIASALGYGNLGGWSVYNSSFYNGKLDEVRVWTVARTPLQLKDAMKRKIANNVPGLLYYYKMLESGGGTVNESVSNANQFFSVPNREVPSSSPMNYTAQYNWSNGGTTSTNSVSESGTYFVSYIDNDGCETGISSESVEVTSSIVGNPTAFGDTVWNVYAWNAGGAIDIGTSWNSNYSGYYSVGGLNFNSQNQWNGNLSPSLAPGYQGCTVLNDNHSWSAKRQGFPCGLYSINIPGHDDEAELWIDGVQVWQHVGCCDAHNNVWTGVLDGNSTVEFRVTEGGGGSNGSISFNPISPQITGLTGLCSAGQTTLGVTPSLSGYYIWSTESNDSTVIVNTSGPVNVTINIDGCEITASGTVVVPIGDTTVYGDTSWNVYAWNAGGATNTGTSWNTNYSGYYTVGGLNFNTQNQWNQNLSPSSASSYQGCPVANDNHSWSAKRRGFDCGYYQINVLNHDDYAELWVNDSLIYPGSDNWKVILDSTSTVEFRVTEGGGSSLGSFNIVPITFDIVASNNFICGIDSVVLTIPLENVSYLWSPGGYTTQHNTIFNAGQYIAAITSQSGCILYDTINIDAVAPPVIGITSDTTICAGTELILTATGAENYIWSPTPIPDIDLNKATLIVGLHKINQDYTGPAIQLRRSTDDALSDFGFIGNDLDTASILSWLNGAEGYCKTLYDQSGNYNHVFQSNYYAQPQFRVSGLNGKPILRYNTNQFMFNSTNFETPYSITYGARLIGSSRYRVLASISNNWLLGFWNGARAKAFFEGWVSSDLNTPIADNKFYIYTGSGNGTTSSLFENGNLLYNNNGGLAGPDGIMLNGWQGGYETSDCEISDVMAFPFELTDEERKSVENITALYYTNTTFGQASIKVKPTSTTIYTVNGKDANGCVGSNSITVSVNAPPQINCPTDLNYILETNTCEKVVNYSPATATGNGPFSFSYSINSGSTFNIGTTKVEVVATDALGCSASCSFNITVIDTVSPIIISCPESQSLTDTGSCGELIYFDLPEVLENCPATKTSVRTFNFTGNVQKFIVPSGVNTLKITAIGAKGGNSVNINGGKGASLTGDFNVTPGDTIYLMVGEKGQDNDGIGGGGGGGGTFVSKSANFLANLMLAAGGGGGAGRIGKSDASISVNGKRGNNLYYYGGGYEGNNGNGGEATAGGGGAGWLNSGSNNYYYCNNSGTKPSMGGMGGDASYCVSLYSAKGGYGGGGGSAFGGGGGGGYSGGGGGDGFDDTENYYVCGCIDYGYGGGGGSLNNGNNPVNVTGAGTGNGIVTIEFLENFPSITQTAGFKSGSVFPAGTTTNEWIITDASGNTTTCSMDVTVIDVTPPEIICPSNLIVSNDSGQCSAIVYYEMPQIIDPCYIDNNDYENMVFLGTFRSSKYYISTNQLNWTTSKSITEGYGGHLVTINSEAEKNFLAAFDKTFWIGLSDEQTEGVFQWVTGEPYIYNNWNSGEPNNSGNEDYIEMFGLDGFWNDLPNDYRNYVMEIPLDTTLLQRIAGPPIGSTFSLGTTTITYVASDLFGNKDTCSFTVTVNDTEAPKIINNASNQTAFVNNNCLVAVPDFTIGVLAIDNCNSSGQLSINQSPSIGSSVGRGINTITISIADTSGNVVTSTATFTVLDTIAPQIQCVSNLIVKANEGDTSAIVNFATPTITDNCDLLISDSIQFVYSGVVQEWIVPQQVSSIKIKAWGAQGGSATNNNNPDAGGKGGYAEGIINTTPGETLYIYVGGAGGPDNTGGFNGGGLGNTYNLNNSSSGGGASDVRKNGNTLNDRVIVAGGGGGAEWGGNCGTNCAGGGLIGLDGLGSYSPAAGLGGTQTAGGAGGQNFCYFPDPFSNPGGFGFGGNAGRSGGGGGGGWYGGGSGGCDGNGGGGSSYIEGLIAGNTATGVRSGNGLIQIEYFFIATAQQTSGPVSGSNFPLGNTTVEWTTTDASDNTSTCEQTITVVDECPPLNITASAPTVLCPGGSVTLTASSGYGYQWSNGDTTQSITINAPANAALSNTLYSVQSVTAINCPVQTSNEIMVSIVPVSQPVITGDSLLCSGGNVTLTASAPPNVNNGVSLNGITELVGDGSLGVTHNGELTVEFWAKRNTNSAYGAILAASNFSLLMGFNPFGNFQLSIGEFFSGDPNLTTVLLYNELDTLWHHWAGTISATEMKLYRDGILLSAEPVTTTFSPAILNEFFVGTNGGDSVTFDGKLDEMRIWSSIRSQAEIQANMFSVVPVDAPQLKGYFRFDEGSGPKTSNLVNGVYGLAFSNGEGWESPGTAPIGVAYEPKYLWSTGAITSSISVNPASTTTYTVTNTNINGCSQSATKTVVVNNGTPPAIPGIIPGPAVNICVGTTQTYTIAPVSGASSYLWTTTGDISIIGGQGTTSATFSFGLGFTTGSVRVQALNACNLASPIRAKTLKSSGLATPGIISGLSDGVCINTSQIYTIAPVSGATSYQWSVGSGDVILSGNPTGTTATFNFEPNFTTGVIRVQAMNACGGSGYRTLGITSIPPVPGAVTGQSTGICAGSSASYSIIPLPGVVYQWSTTGAVTINGSDTGNTVTVDFGANFLNGSVSVRSVNACGTSTLRTLVLKGQVVPTPGIISGVSSPVCPNTSQTYTIAPVSGITNYFWSTTGDAVITSGQGTTSATFSFGSGFGTGTIRVQSQLGCGLSAVRSLAVKAALPAAPLSITGSAAVCANSSGISYSAAAVAGATGYIWTTTGDISITGGQGTQDATFDFGTAFSTGTIRVQAQNNCGLSATRTLTIGVVSTKAPFSISGPVMGVCANTSGVSYTAAAVAGAASYVWSATGDISIATGQGSQTATFNFGPTFSTGTIRVQAVNACGTLSVVNLLTVRALPNIPSVISGNLSAIVPGTSETYSVTALVGATSYEWVLPANASIASGSGTNSITLDFAPAFTGGILRVRALNACGATAYRSATLSIVPAVGGSSPVSRTTTVPLSIYPNPAKDKVMIQGEGIQSIRLFDVSGKLLQSVFCQSEYQVELNLNYPAGMYFIEVYGDGWQESKKLMIAK